VPKPPTASVRPASLVVAGIVLLQLMLPTPPVVAGGPVVAPPSEETSGGLPEFVIPNQSIRSLSWWMLESLR